MISIIQKCTLILFSAFLITSCFDETGNPDNIINPEKPDVIISDDTAIPNNNITDNEITDNEITDEISVTPEDARLIIEDAIQDFFDTIEIPNLEEINGSTITIAQGLTVVVEVSYNPYKVEYTFIFDDFDANTLTINGSMTASTSSQFIDGKVIMLLNTEESLVITGYGLDETIIRIVDLSVCYDFPTIQILLSGKIIINDIEYNFEDILPPLPEIVIPSYEEIMEILKDTIAIIFDMFDDWKNFIEKITLKIKEGLTIEIECDPDTFEIEITYIFSECNIMGAIINGSMSTHLIRSIAGTAVVMTINTEDTLTISYDGVNNTIVKIVNLTALFDILKIEFNFSGNIIVNDTEYSFNEIDD